jgi:uncharacterized protein (TIGR00730 family)
MIKNYYMMNSIAVFCGSSDGFNDIYRETAWQLGEILAEKGIRLVYGGAKIGVMGALADGAMDKKGRVTGVIPVFLQTKELVHEGITDLVLVKNMHERKLKMHELSEGVITLPGGWGTMDELFEMLTWAQLGLHQKPIGLLNINGYFDSLKVLFNNMVLEGFLDESCNKMLLISESIDELLEMMNNYEAPEVPTVISKQTT